MSEADTIRQWADWRKLQEELQNSPHKEHGNWVNLPAQVASRPSPLGNVSGEEWKPSLGHEDELVGGGTHGYGSRKGRGDIDSESGCT